MNYINGIKEFPKIEIGIFHSVREKYGIEVDIFLCQTFMEAVITRSVSSLLEKYHLMTFLEKRSLITQR